MSKNPSAKYYKDNKKGCKKRLVKDIKVFLEKKKKKTIYTTLSEDEKRKPG